MDAAISLGNVTKGFERGEGLRSHAGLHDISLDIPRGKVTAAIA